MILVSFSIILTIFQLGKLNSPKDSQGRDNYLVITLVITHLFLQSFH